jgi:two-component system sensor histidine kinase ResE
VPRWLLSRAIAGVFSSVRLKIILPYLLLTVLITVLSLFTVSSRMTGGLEVRAARQLLATNVTLSLLLFSAAAALVVLVGLFVAQRIVSPVSRLERVSRAIADGDFSQRVDISASDELGTLAQSFDLMADNLEESTQALHQEVARVHAILGSIADGVIVRDNDGEVVLMNAAARSMLAQTNFKNSPLAGLQLRSENDGDGHLVVAAQTHRVELNDRMVVSVRIAPVMPDNGKPAGTVLVMRDVTRDVAAERLKDDFINNISHELRTPLTVIKGYSDLLKLDEKQAQVAVYKKAMAEIFTNAASLERMIARLIDLSEMAAGTLRLAMHPTSLNQFVMETLGEWDEALRENGLTAQIHMVVEDLMIMADERRLRWAFDAILENAIQYCPRGSDLDVNLSRLESTALIQFRDRGVGISGEDLPHVFKRFYRGHPVDVDDGVLDPRGMGQGLYVVKSVVEAHGGRVWVESEVGKGSVFSLLIPLVKGQAD